MAETTWKSLKWTWKSLKSIPTGTDLNIEVYPSGLPPHVYETGQGLNRTLHIESPRFELIALVHLPGPATLGPPSGTDTTWSIGWVVGASEYTLKENYRSDGMVRVRWKNFHKGSHVGDTEPGEDLPPGWYSPLSVLDLANNCHNDIVVALSHQHVYSELVHRAEGGGGEGDDLRSVDLCMRFTAWLVACKSFSNPSNGSKEYIVLYRVQWGFKEIVGHGPGFSKHENQWIKEIIKKYNTKTEDEDKTIPDAVFTTLVRDMTVEKF